MNPLRGRTFHSHQHIGEAVRGSEPDEQVDVIRGSADRFRYGAEGPQRPAQVSVKAPAPGFGNQRAAVLGADDHVVMKAQMGGWLSAAPSAAAQGDRFSGAPDRGAPRISGN